MASPQGDGSSWAGQSQMDQGGIGGGMAGNREVRLDELSKYFHLPEKEVAKELGICLTSLKKLCR